MLSKILIMGGYGIYVWPCYILLLLGLASYVLYSLRKSILVLQKLKIDQ